MKKFLIYILLSLSILLLYGMSVPAGDVYAEDLDGDGIDDDEDDQYMYYDGELDIYTGKPVSETTSNQTGRVSVTDYCQYDFDNHWFCYPVNGGTLYVSVADGMITTNEVTFAIGGEFNLSIYKDGNKLNGIPKSVSEPGSYTAITWDENSETQLMTFRIVKKTTGVITQYVMPDGFNVSSVSIDGVEQPRSFGSVDMNTDGYYEIRYLCTATGITYTLVVTMDHIPPQIIYDGVDKEGRARGPVTLSGFQNGDTVSVTLNNRSTSLKSGNRLTETGKYRVVVYDEAGNSSVKEFQILLYLNVKSFFLFAAFVAIIIGIFVALYITRKRLRVR